MKSRLLNKTMGLLALSLSLLALQPVFAQPVMLPRFLIIEDAYMDAAADDAESTNAYFTITNLHDEPIRLLSMTSGAFEGSTLFGANGEEIEFIEVLPGQTMPMDSAGYHVRLNNLESGADNYPVEFTLIVRQGREALPYQEAGFNNGTRRTIREGIPNEHEVVVNVPVR